MSKLKKIIFILIIAVIAIFVYCNRVEAIPVSSVGDTITIGYANTSYNEYAFKGTSWLYCIQHPGAFSSWKKNKYTVRYKITINGSTAKNESNGKTTTNKFNAIMSYILAVDGYERGYWYNGHHTTRQYAVWYYWNTWLSNNASGLGIDSANWKTPQNEGKSSLNTTAEKWYSENSSNSSSSASIAGNKSAEYVNYSEGIRYIEI